MSNCACFCYSMVDQATIGVVERCGAYRERLEPGFHCIAPCCGDCLAHRISLRVQQQEFQVETKTHDNVFVSIHVAVQFKVVPDRIREAVYTLENPASQIRSYVYDALRSHIPTLDLDAVFEAKDEIALVVQKELKMMEQYGYEIVKVLVTDLVPDHKVKVALNEINANQRLLVATQSKAEAEKLLRVKAAEAEAESRHLAGRGLARAREEIILGLERSVHTFTEHIQDVTPSDVMTLILMTQYLDTIKEVGAHSHSNAIFMNHSPTSATDIAEQIRNGMLQAKHLGSSPVPHAPTTQRMNETEGPASTIAAPAPRHGRSLPGVQP